MLISSARALSLALLTACWLLPAGEAQAVCTGIGAVQSCSDGLSPNATADESKRRMIKFNSSFGDKSGSSKPALEEKYLDPNELKAADKTLNFSSMYPGFAAGGKAKASAPFCAVGACR